MTHCGRARQCGCELNFLATIKYSGRFRAVKTVNEEEKKTLVSRFSFLLLATELKKLSWRSERVAHIRNGKEKNLCNQVTILHFCEAQTSRQKAHPLNESKEVWLIDRLHHNLSFLTGIFECGLARLQSTCPVRE